jgi:serine palmitoyltransferase
VLELLGKWWGYIRRTYQENPGHVITETVAIAIIVFLLIVRRYDPKTEGKLSEKEKEALIKEWVPEPLVPKKISERARKRLNHANVIESSTKKGYVTANGTSFMNLASHDFLDVGGDQGIADKCKQVIQKYGVGSCGPRGFYGTIDTHLNVESDFSTWLGTEDAILYSDGIACISSVIPAFAKKGDLVICDDAANFYIESGIRLSRANVIYFKHNDMAHLEQVLKGVRENDINKPFKNLNRRFIVVEGLYQNRGDICPLDKVVDLKNKYKYRLILDDSMALGVLGKTGKGSAEYWNVPLSEVDILSFTLDTAIASVGGICAGSKKIVDHQRLGGIGYCFSASSPPYTCVAASEALKLISREPQRGQKVQENAKKIRILLANYKDLSIEGADISPIVLIRPSSYPEGIKSGEDELTFLEEVARRLASEHKIFVSVTTYVPNESRPPRPSLKVLVTAGHCDKDLEKAAKAIQESIASQKK